MIRLSRSDMFGPSQPANLKSSAIRGGATTLVGQFVQFGLQTATTVVLARLLTPDDYGLVAMVAVVIGFAQLFRDAGLATATIQRPTITREQIDTLFWVNLAISAAIAGCVVLFAPLVAHFYGESELAPITAALGVTFLIGGVTIQHEALLRRHMRFRALVAVQLLSQLTNLAVAVALAASGLGYWALVGGWLAASLSASLLTLLFCPFVPGRPRRGVGVRSMLVFGGHITGFSVVNYFGRNMDNILIGRFLGPTELGLYSRAYTLFMVPITQIRAPISQVALPVLSSLVAEPERYRRYYLRLLEAVTLLAAPATVYCVLEAEFLVRLLLGPGWAGVVPVFRILAVAGMVQPMASTVGLVFVSLGHADRQLKNGAVNSAVAVIAFCLGLPFGIEGVAAFYAVSSYLVLVPMLRYAFRGSPIRTADFAITVWFPVTAALGAGIAVLVVERLMGTTGTLWHAAVAVLFFGAYVALVFGRGSARQTLKALILEARTRQ